MSLDGIRKVRKEYPQEEEPFPGPVSWGIDSLRPRKITPAKIEKEKWSWSDFLKEIRTHFLNRRLALASLGVVLIISLMSITVSSYNFLSQNYDFLKLFNSGRYLILFQNNTEMRATGGFIGSFAVIETNKGILKDYYFETNIHKLDDPFAKTNPIKPPGALANLVSYWVMEDANWAIDYPTAAQQVAWFYEQEGGQPVDGVVAVNATVMNDLLEIIGPIQMPEYGMTLTADNFLELVQYEVEEGYFTNPVNKEINEPKTILKDMIPKLITRLAEKRYYSQITDLVKKELQEKQILFYFYDDNKEKIVRENNWAGEVKQFAGDYLYVNNSNLAANKSSLNVKEDLKLNVSISDQDTVINNLTITRTHTGDGQWPDGENKNYLRVLVPYGAKLISAKLDEVGYLEEIKVEKEAGKTAFGFYMNTQPRSSRILTLTYELPMKMDKNNYALYVQKQPGNLGDDLQVLVDGEIKFNGILNIDREIR